MKSSRRNFKTLRAMLEQETEENNFRTEGLNPRSADTIDWGELSSQPILKVDEPICLKSSRRNFKILRARLEQETEENHFFKKVSIPLEGVVPKN